MKNLLAFTGLFLLLQESISQPSSTQYTDAFRLIDTWIEAQREYKKIPSISLAVVSDQDIIWSKAFGMANMDSRQAASTGTLYSICSISKLFTSVAIMQLYDAGKLRLDDNIEAILPNYKLKQQFKESGPITIRSLLTHSSGLPRESDFPYWTGPDFPFPTQEQMIARLSEQQTLYPSSTIFQYSNLGLTLLGEVVEKLSGKKFDDYVEENILKPLRLNSTHTYIPKEEWGKKMAIGYGAIKRDGSRDKVNLFDTKGIKAAAGFSSNVEDLARFASWQFRLLNKGGNEILKSSTLKEMVRVQWADPDWKLFRGLGFNIAQFEGASIFGHGGSCPGYRSTLQLDSKEKMAYTVMINAGGESPELFVKEIREVLSLIPRDKIGKKDSLNLVQYSGTYSSQPWGSERIVRPWYGDLVMLSLPSESPDEDMVVIRHVSGDIFKRVRRDKTLGEEIKFERDNSGKVYRILQHSNYSTRVAPDRL